MQGRIVDEWLLDFEFLVEVVEVEDPLPADLAGGFDLADMVPLLKTGVVVVGGFGSPLGSQLVA